MHIGKTLLAQFMDRPASNGPLLLSSLATAVIDTWRRSPLPNNSASWALPTDLLQGTARHRNLSLGQVTKLSHTGFRQEIKRATLAGANTNNFTLSSKTVCAVYKVRRQVELFFKWIQQYLRVNRFFGTSENAMQSQIWIPVSVYVLAAIVEKGLTLEAVLYTLLQIVLLTLLEKMPTHIVGGGGEI